MPLQRRYEFTDASILIPTHALRNALFPVLATLLLALGAGPAMAQLVVNEIDYDQSGTDAAEFVEIKNTSGSSVDLSAYSLELVNGTGGGAAVYDTIALPAVSLAAGDYYVVCANAATVANCDLDDGPDTNFIQNGAPDAVAIRMGTTLIDTVSYEGNTGAPYTEGSGGGLTDDSSVSDFGLSRFPDGADTDQNNADLFFCAITPGAANDCPAVVPELVINEIMQNPSAVLDGSGEWFEIHNPTGAPIDIEGWTISDNDSDSHVINNGGPLLVPAGGYAVLGNNADSGTNGGVPVDYTYGASFFLGNGSDELVLTDTLANEIDRVEWDNGTTFPDPNGASMSLINPALDNNAGANWCTASTPFGDGDLGTPGAANDCPAGSSVLVINEIDYDQPGTDAAEFVEIKNAGTDPVNLAGWAVVLVNGTGGGAAIYDTINLPGVSLAAGDYFVVCGDAGNTFNCDLDVTPNTNLVQNGAPDAVALTQGGVLIDTVSYEGDTGAPYTEGSGSGLQDPGTGGSGGVNEYKGISRFPDGADTDQNNVDLSTRCITPGAANSADASNCALPGPPSLVVNEIDYDQPGGDTAEFVEIKNVGAGAANLTGVDLVLVNGATGSPYGTFPLPSVTLAAGDYYVVCTNAATVANCDLDVLSSIQNGSPDAVALRFDGAILDTVSYEGDTAGYTEGSGTGLADSGSSGEDFKGISRFPDGVDTDVNNVDLKFVCITPGGANADRTTNCSPTGPILEIFEIQGSGFASPFDGSVVNTADNVVTAVAPNGFFMQTPVARTDGDSDTSDGIFVFTGGAPGVAVGDLVDVEGEVDEFFGFTELTSATVTPDGTGTVPTAVMFNATVPSPDPDLPSCAIEFECYEGMLIEIADGTVTGPNQRFGTDPIAEVHITAADTRTFREPGIEFPGFIGYPVWDGNPEVFELDPDKLGLPNQIIPAGSTFSATGVLGFEFGGYELWPSVLDVTPAVLPDPVRERIPGELTVGTLNLFRLFDDVDDPSDLAADGRVRDDSVVSTAEYMRRLAKFAVHIVDVLGAPDILAVQEVESLKVLEDLATEIGLLYPSVVYSAHLVEGNDVGTIDIGFLTREHIQVDAITQLGRDETYENPLTGEDEILHDRPPLLLEGFCLLEYGAFPITVMTVHNRSLGGIEGSEGLRVRQKRYEQATSIAGKVQAIQAGDPGVRLVVTGDFNAFEFTDGYADAVNIIKGDYDPLENLVCETNTCDDIVEPDLTNEVLGLPAPDRYSFIFAGSAQVLDHALTSEGLAGEMTGAEYGRGNADAAVDLINDGTTLGNIPLRSSDHDGLVVYILKDEDNDGVPNDDDVCSGTVIPESVPTQHLGVNRFALVDGDGVFDTVLPEGEGPGKSFTVGDTAGCSCEQIIDAQQLGQGHQKFGCSIGEMEEWVELVSQP